MAKTPPHLSAGGWHPQTGNEMRTAAINPAFLSEWPFAFEPFSGGCTFCTAPGRRFLTQQGADTFCGVGAHEVFYLCPLGVHHFLLVRGEVLFLLPFVRRE